MAVFVPYQNYVEITGLTHDGVWRNSADLSGFLQNPSATGVILRIQNEDGSARIGGAFGILGGGVEWLHSMASFGGCYNLVHFQLDGAAATGLRQIRYNLAVANVTVYIVGELHAGIAWQPYGITVNPDAWGDNNTWLDRTVTVLGDDAVGDVEAVLLSFTAVDTLADGQIGLRAKGSTYLDDEKYGLTFNEAAIGWQAVKVDSNGEYQIYCTAKEDPFTQGTLIKELGYIRKGAGYTAILNPINEDPGEGSFPAGSTVSLADLVPESCRVAVMAWGMTAPVAIAGTRQVGSANGGFVLNEDASLGCEVRRLTLLEKEFEFVNTQAAKKLFVLGYESYEPVENAATVTIDSEVDVVIEGGNSMGVG